MSLMHPVVVLDAALCKTCSFCMFVFSNARGDHEVEAYSRWGLVIALWVGMRLYFCLPHVIVLNAFVICSGLCTLVAVFLMCVLYVSCGSRMTPKIFGCVLMGSVHLFICSSRLQTEQTAFGFVWLKF